MLPILLLLALPASGKSEVCRYLAHLDDEVRAAEMHLGPLVLLDDYPYVLFMRRASQELRRLGSHPVLFSDDKEPMPDPRIWGTLIELLNEDYLALETAQTPGRGVHDLFARIDAAATAAGAPPAFSMLDPELLAAVADALEREEAAFSRPSPTVPLSAKTSVLIEFARGGPRGTDSRMLPPRGYRHSLSLLRPEILERAAILYIWVTPEQSRRRNRERARPGGDASILHHHVPEQVMHEEYGCDDLAWMLDHAERPGTVTVTTAESTFHVPAVRFDNRADRTSFLRAEPEDWPPRAVAELHAALSAAMGGLQR